MHTFTDFRTTLRRRILTGLGLASILHTACGADGDPAGTTDHGTTDPTGTTAPVGPTEPTGTTTATGPTSTTAAPTTTDPTTGEPPADSSTGDLGTTTAPADDSESTGSSDASGLDTGDTTTGSSTGAPADDTTTGLHDVERCFPLYNGGCPDLQGAEAAYDCGPPQFEHVAAWLSGPVMMGDQCCYQVDIGPPGDCFGGRPFVVDGRVCHAPVRAGARGWHARADGPRTARRSHVPGAPELADLDAASRSRLGRAWARDAAFEHASVASFGKLALELLAFGAPAGLVRAAHEAALDEVRHAELCFALASRYLGAPLGPDALPGAAAFTGARTLADLAAAAVHEGCVGETLAAAVAAAQRDAATDPAVRSTLAVIAEEEGGHAVLSYRIVAWALAAGDAAVRCSVHAAFQAALQALAREAPGDEPADSAARAHGRLSRAEELAERRRAVDEVVRPAMLDLLGLPS